MGHIHGPKIIKIPHCFAAGPGAYFYFLFRCLTHEECNLVIFLHSPCLYGDGAVREAIGISVSKETDVTLEKDTTLLNTNGTVYPVYRFKGYLKKIVKNL